MVHARLFAHLAATLYIYSGLISGSCYRLIGCGSFRYARVADKLLQVQGLGALLREWIDAGAYTPVTSEACTPQQQAAALRRWQVKADAAAAAAAAAAAEQQQAQHSPGASAGVGSACSSTCGLLI